MVFSCRKAVRLLHREMDGELAGPGKLALRMHLLMCRLCRNYRTQLVWLQSILGLALAEGPDPGPGLSPEARERIRARLRRLS